MRLCSQSCCLWRDSWDCFSLESDIFCQFYNNILGFFVSASETQVCYVLHLLFLVSFGFFNLTFLSVFSSQSDISVTIRVVRLTLLWVKWSSEKPVSYSFSFCHCTSHCFDISLCFRVVIWLFFLVLRVPSCLSCFTVCCLLTQMFNL